MTEPTPASKELFDKLKEIERELSPDAVKLLKAIVKIARDTFPTEFTQEFEEAFTPYPQSTINANINCQEPDTGMIIVNAADPTEVCVSPPTGLHVDGHHVSS